MRKTALHRSRLQSPWLESMQSTKDGFPIEGAQAPVYLKKNLPIALEFSHKVPFLTYPSMNDFFEIADVWEGSTVFAGRSTLRNLARCFLFPADDYYCREFTIDAGYLRGKLLLQRHMEDISDQKDARQQDVFDGLNAALSWIKQCFERNMASKREAADVLAQAQIRFTTAGGRKQLVFVPLAKTQHVEMLSENVVQGINVLAT